MAADTETMLLVGTTKGLFVYRSDKARKTWTVAGPHLPGWEVSAAAAETNADGRPTGRIWLGTTHYAYGATVRISDDFGQNWRQADGRPEYPKETGWALNRIWQIRPGHPGEPNTLYAGVDEAGLFVSRDRGETWREVEGLTRVPSRAKWQPGAGGLCLHTILIDPADAKRMWVGISAVGAFRTTDGGATWTPSNVGLPALPTGSDDPVAVYCVHKMVLDPAGADRLYMQFHGGVLRTDDAGEHWTPIENGLPGNFGFPMVVTRKGELFVIPLVDQETRTMGGGRLAVYRSRDRGDSWQSLTRGLPTEPQHVGVLRDAMAVDPHDQAGVYFGTSMGEVYASPDAGDSWTKLPGTLPRVTTVRAYRA